MPSEAIKTRTTPLQKAKLLFDKMELYDAIENYNELGKYIHERIQVTKKIKASEIEELSQKQNQLNGTNTQ